MCLCPSWRRRIRRSSAQGPSLDGKPCLRHSKNWIMNRRNSNAGSRTSRRHRPCHLPKENVLKNNSIPQAGKRAAIYVRTSTERQAEKVSPEAQEADCKALCERQGYQVVEVYRD